MEGKVPVMVASACLNPRPEMLQQIFQQAAKVEFNLAPGCGTITIIIPKDLNNQGNMLRLNLFNKVNHSNIITIQQFNSSER